MAAATAATTTTEVLRDVVRVATAPKQREGGGFVVRRAIGGALEQIDPFLMLDHFGPATYGPGEAVGAPDHPHRGQETVTYMVQGTFEHKDSFGNTGTLNNGWVQWMTAGSGLVHSEMPSAEIREKGGTVEGFQLWVNLPRKDKMIAPRYQDTPADKIPLVPIPGASEGSTVKVIAGEACGASAVIDTRTPIVYFDVTLASAGDRFVHPLGAEFAAVVYTFRSTALVGSGKARVTEGQAAEFHAEEGSLAIEAAEGITEPVRCLVIGGVPLKEPVVQYGPFVMNTREEIMDAIRDFQAGKMGRIDGEEERMRETRRGRAAQERTGRWGKDSEEL